MRTALVVFLQGITICKGKFIETGPVADLISVDAPRMLALFASPAPALTVNMGVELTAQLAISGQAR
jgi:hypothetical protein